MPTPKITFTHEGKTYEAPAALFRERGLVLLLDGTLLHAGGFDDETPFAVTVVPHAKAVEIQSPS